MKSILITLFASVSIIAFTACNASNDNHNHDAHAGHNHDAHAGHNHDTHAGHNHDAHAGHNHDAHAGHNHDAHAGHNHDAHAGHNHDAHAGHNHDAHADHNHDAHAGHNHSGDEILFSAAKAKQFGVKATKVKAGNFHETIKVSGQIIGAQGDEYTVVAQSAGIIKFRSSIAVGSTVAAGSAVASVSAKNIVGGDSNEHAQIVLNNAKRELDRLKPLFEEKIVTAREYNAALENYERAKAACTSKSGAGNIASTAISGTITEIYATDGQFVEAGAPVAKVSKNARLVLRADLPTAYAKHIANIKTANFRTSNSDEMLSIESLKGRRISSNTSATTQPGYIPVCFEFTNNGSIVSGTFAEIYLIGNERPNTISIPVKSLTEELGTFYVYIKLDEECYMKRAVTVGINDGQNVEILSGLHENELVVSEGAMIIKLAGSGAAIPGHSHEH